MTSSIILVVALVLAPGLQCATLQTRELPIISTYPIPQGTDQIQTLPGIVELPVMRPLPVPVPEAPVLRPQPIPEIPVLRPQPVPEKPVLRPHPMPEVEPVLPELIAVNPCDACFEYMTALIDQLAGSTPEIVPHPMPTPEIEILPHPLPEIEVLPPRPLPEFIPIVPEVGTRPFPVQPEIRPLPSVIRQ